MSILKRTVRGIRDSIPSGYIIGRLSSTEGPAQMIDLKTLSIAQRVAMGGHIDTQVGLQADFGFFFQGKPAFSNMLLAAVVFTKAVRLDVGLAGGVFKTFSPPLSDYTVTLNKNGASIGTIKFTATTGAVTIVFATAVLFVPGDSFSIAGPLTADPALQDISFNFAATFI